jgi:hypothetical protein
LWIERKTPLSSVEPEESECLGSVVSVHFDFVNEYSHAASR